MKRLQLTPELIAKIKAAVGDDVDPSNFAVFESISLNTLPLPGKRGGLFENATVSALTLKQMADSITSGTTLPLMFNHDMTEVPVGRVFDAAVALDSKLGDTELRTLFYIDPTEEQLAAKVDNGTLDEVSVQFLASEILCSECSFDYRGEDATFENLLTRTCENGHTVGTDGVHVRLVGLASFTELSLVPRGAASKPKIVGQSQSKLAAPLQRLAAKGFEVSELFCAASLGEVNVDLTALLARNEEIVTENVTLKAQVTALTGERDAATADLAAANDVVAERDTRIGELEAELTAAQAAPEATAAAELTAAKEFLSDIFTKLATAAGVEAPKAPETIADLKAGIEQHQSKLTAALPIGGAAASTQTAEAKTGAKFNARSADAFAVAR